MSNGSMTSIETEIESIFNAFCVSDEWLSDRFASLEITQGDIRVMLDLNEKLVSYQDEINISFSSYIFSVYKNALLNDSDGRKNLFNILISNFHHVTDGKYTSMYMQSRFAIGIAHRKLGLPFEQLISDYSKYKSLLRPVIWRFCNNDVHTLVTYMEALSKIIYFEIGIALEAYSLAGKAEPNQISAESIPHIGQWQSARNYDSQSGLPSRQSFKNQLAHLLQIAENKTASVALIKLGLDQFRNLNNLEGYETGDLILKEIGIGLQRYLGKDDLVAYWGGDNFIVALSNLDQTSNIDLVCNEIDAIVCASNQSNARNIALTCSMGIAVYPQDCLDVETLIKYCDSSMNLAKQTGGNKFQFFNKNLDARLNERLVIAKEIQNAIDTDQFVLYYQPVVNLESGEIVGMEALIRWQHPERGLMQPGQFIDIAEEFSSINQLGWWVIRRACIDIIQWRGQGIMMPRIAINVSPKQLLEPAFINNLLATLDEFDVKPENITLEITESMLIHHSQGMEKLLRELKAKNFYLSMDDFGTGYSALQYLKHYPFDYVKIDQSFVRNILENSNDAAIANAVIAMSHSMGIQVIAEGVETESQCMYLSQNMCDHFQGFLLSPPIPSNEAGELIAEKFRLPEHLLRMTRVSRTLLLVDDEPNILSALKRLFRQDGYKILTASSGAEGLEMLCRNHVDVIISDQRMPNMTGVEFLRQAKGKYQDTVRIVLSGYTELQSITDAINEGSIYKFLTKPWDDGLLRAHISDAFMQKEMFDENRRLGMKVQTTNLELAAANRKLADILEAKEKQLHQDEISLDIAREALQHIPIPMIGIDDDGMVAFVNAASELLFSKNTALLGSPIDEILPSFNRLSEVALEGNNFTLDIPDFKYRANWRALGVKSKSRGKIITFFAEK